VLFRAHLRRRCTPRDHDNARCLRVEWLQQW